MTAGGRLVAFRRSSEDLRLADEKLWGSNRGPGMPTIVFASSKGGAGKSTSAVLLATQLAERSAEVTLIDADPNRHVAVWASKPGPPPNITVVADVTEQTVIRQVDEAARQTAFVIVDLE